MGTTTVGMVAVLVCATSAVAQPANDECVGAIEIFDGPNEFDTSGATSTTAMTMCDSNLDEEVWYTYTAICDDDITFNACQNPGEDTVLEVLQGTDCGDMVSVGCSDDDCGDNGYQSTVTVTAALGDIFFIAVSGYNGGAVVGDLSVEGGGPPTGACCHQPYRYCEDGVTEADCAYVWYEDKPCSEVTCGIPCASHVDCVLANNNACEWNECDLAAGVCNPPIPRIYGDVCGADFPLPPNGVPGKLTDILCTLNAFGAGNLHNCPNADVAAVTEADCPHGNGIVNLTDVLKVMDTLGAIHVPVPLFCDCPMNPDW